MMIGYGDVHDLILGSGACSYSWYTGGEAVIPSQGDSVWLVKLHMEDPDGGPDRVVSVTYSGIIDVCRKVVDDTEDSGYGTSAIYGVTEECREQAYNLLEDDYDSVDFDAFTADEILQVLAYGEVIFS